MALIEIEDLPATTAEVLRRRAEDVGLPVSTYVCRELVALAARRAPTDAVVDFLESERPDHPTALIDDEAMALLHTYDLPPTAWTVLCRRAGAVGIPLSDYVRQELVTLARRTAVADVLIEFRRAQLADPSLEIDMGAVLESIRYARGQ